MLGHRFADEDGRRPPGDVRITEIAATHDGDTHGAHVTGTNETHVDFWLLGHRQNRTSLDRNGLV